LALFCCTFAAAAQPNLDWIDRDAIAAREVQIVVERSNRPLTAEVKVASEVDAPATAIWDVLKACEIAPEYVPNVVSCRKVEELDGGRADLFMQTIKPIFFVPAFEHEFRLDYTPYTRIDVNRVSGPIAHMQGTWWLLPEDNGRILLVYELTLDPGMPIPRFFVRATLKHDLPRLVAAIRERAEAAAP
ncbi:MAG TPA: SRPBCC family protein, partial [Gammaproteobacteria bacterium]|nr:SRPBCC family protein [Gammaproteobacteria bacterium]